MTFHYPAHPSAVGPVSCFAGSLVAMVAGVIRPLFGDVPPGVVDHLTAASWTGVLVGLIGALQIWLNGKNARRTIELEEREKVREERDRERDEKIKLQEIAQEAARKDRDRIEAEAKAEVARAKAEVAAAQARFDAAAAALKAENDAKDVRRHDERDRQNAQLQTLIVAMRELAKTQAEIRPAMNEIIANFVPGFAPIEPPVLPPVVAPEVH